MCDDVCRKANRIVTASDPGTVQKLPGKELAETRVFLLSQQGLLPKILTFPKACRWQAAGILYTPTLADILGQTTFPNSGLFSPMSGIAFTLISQTNESPWVVCHFHVTAQPKQPKAAFCRIERRLGTYTCDLPKSLSEKGDT